MGTYILADIPVQVETDSLLLKYNLPLDGDDAQHLRALTDIAIKVCQPKVLYKEAIIEARETDYVVVDGIKLSSTLLCKNLAGVERIYPYILTCGHEIATWAKSLNDALDMYWLDMIMEMALNQAMAAFESHLHTHYDLNSSSNMNPGALPDWPLCEQKQLFQLLGVPDKSIGVVLTESFLMLPFKSLSGIRFYGEEEFINCQVCDRDACPNRRVAYLKTKGESL